METSSEKRFAVYRCSLCGGFITLGEMSDLPGVSLDCFSGAIGGIVPKVHRCGDGNEGLAYPAGIVTEENLREQVSRKLP